MSLIFYYFFMSLALSMDAFSLAVIYGTTSIRKKQIIIVSILVGIFHFIMPNLGSLLTNILSINFNKYTSFISGIIFLILAIEMIISFNDNDIKYSLEKIPSLLLFGIAVSLDSFSIGIALQLDNESVLSASLVFSIVSFMFTFLGLLLGKYLSNKVGSISKIIGIIILVLLSVKYFLNI